MVTIAWSWRWWHRVASVFRPVRRPMTELEARLRDENERLRLENNALYDRVRALQTDVKALEAEKSVMTLELRKFADVVERDRLRVHAEMAHHASAIAGLAMGRQPEEGGVG